MSDYLDPNNEELLKDFFVEAQTQVESLEQNLLVLENEPTNRDAVDEIFRAAHTLKGGAATVQMMELSEFTHLVEDVFDGIRNDEVTVNGELIDTLLASIDIIKAMLDARNEGTVYVDDDDSLKKQLSSYLPGEKKAKHVDTGRSADKTTPEEEDNDRAGAGISEYELLEFSEDLGDDEKLYEVNVQFNEDNPMNTVGGIQVFAALKEVGSVIKTVPDFDELYEDVFHPEVIYYLSSNSKQEEIEDKVALPDVVQSCAVMEVNAGERSKAPAERATVKESIEEDDEAEPTRSEENMTEDEHIGEEAVKEERPKQAELKKTNSKGSVLRVDSSRIDNLLNLVSEAVINKATFNQLNNQFAESLVDLQNTETNFRERQRDLFDNFPDYIKRIQEGATIKEIKKEINENYGDMFSLFDEFDNKLKNTINSFRGTAQNLGRITTELHEKVLQIRMVPIAQIFSRFPRLVRDVSKSLNKKVKLIIEGEDTELDKSVIEDLLDPLIHCVRNSVDHGIESPEERKKGGKNEEGTVLLKASNEGNMIIIEISDDGKGIDINEIKRKSVERGLIHPNKELSEIEAFNLIFEPGFSTAKNVTNISGRGVGLDVVKKQIEKLNGNASVWSQPGAGTRITIKLPLTLAIIQGLLVSVGKEIYAIPITSVLDSHRIRPTDIKMIDNYEVFNVRDDVISLLRLNRLFRIPTEEKQEYHFVVIVGSGEKKMGLVVDRLIGEEDVVIKPLKDKYTNSPGIAGATILGDGTVSLIIDVSQLLELGLKQEIDKRREREATIR